MNSSENIIRENISRIEKRVVELKFIERDLKRERDIARVPLLEKAEKCARVEDFIDSFFLKKMKLLRSDISVTAYPSEYSGRDGDEFLTGVKVEMSYRPEEPSDYSEIVMTLYLTKGFDDPEVRIKESSLTDRILEAEREIEKLREEKRGLRKE